MIEFWYCGFLGCALIILGMTASAIAYRGRQGERYSPFNHFISELGERGTARLAAVFNGGLIAGGLCLLPFIYGLGLALGSPLGWLAAAAGAFTALSAAAVGLFPMNDLKTHYPAAMAYFRGGLATVLLFSAAILAQPAGSPALPRTSALAGLLAASAYLAFLVMLGRTASAELPAEASLEAKFSSERPRLWKTALLEWLVFFATMAWFAYMAGVGMQ